jgi:hypothetical protein
MKKEFDTNVDYTKTGESYERDNYKAFITQLPQEEIVKLLSDRIADSKLVLTNWEKQQLAENLAEVKFGKEKD